MKTAFKEWAAVCFALGRGSSILILRRGGIADPDGAFHPGQGTFLLFPTQFHQSAGQLADAVPANSLATPADDEVVISLCATTAGAWPVPDAASLARLSGLHSWSDAVAAERLERKGEGPLWAVAVRVSALERPVTLKLRPAYRGCRSWIELEEDIEVARAGLVLTDTAFDAELRRVTAALLGH
ncbi:MAG: DUF1802 family protein [Planctomycetota bacterium]